jgi:DNA repair exonuclease SbcCD ATPase subunit
VAGEIQSTVCGCVAGVVSRCLEAVFDEPYEFKMEFVERRGRTEVDLKFVREGKEVDPVTASGGGVVDVASFALRLAALLLSGPKARRILVLDEPFKFLSRTYRPKIRQLLSDLASELSIQIIMVTHIEELQTGTIVEVG